MACFIVGICVYGFYCFKFDCDCCLLWHFDCLINLFDCLNVVDYAVVVIGSWWISLYNSVACFSFLIFVFFVIMIACWLVLFMVMGLWVWSCCCVLWMGWFTWILKLVLIWYSADLFWVLVVVFVLLVIMLVRYVVYDLDLRVWYRLWLVFVVLYCMFSDFLFRVWYFGCLNLIRVLGCFGVFWFGGLGMLGVLMV